MKHLTLLVAAFFLFVLGACELEMEHVPVEEIEENENVVLFQKHTMGDGLMIVLLADGYEDEVGTLYDMYDHLFLEPPYPHLRNYFDVIGIKGMANHDLGITVQGSCYAASASGVTDLVQNILRLSSLNNACIVVAVSPELGAKRSIAYLYSNPQHTTLALCSWSNYSDEYKTYILAHEVGGHCLAGLDDEYVEYDGEISNVGKSMIRTFQQNGLFLNVSLSEKDVPWKELMAEPAYQEKISVIEGGSTYAKGVFRSSTYSLMSSSSFGFNAVSRYLIWNNIHNRAGCPSTLDAFVDYDKMNIGNQQTRSYSAAPLIPDSLRGVIVKLVE